MMMHSSCGKMAASILVVGTLFTAEATAQSDNRLYTDQTGTGNIIDSDQSRATGSRFGGPNDPLLQIGVNNRLQLRDAGLATVMESTRQDTSGLTPADFGNVGTINIRSGAVGAVVSLQQLGGAGSGANTAAIDISGRQTQATVLQQGSANNAVLGVGGLNTVGRINQNGADNFGGLLVGGVGANVTLNQLGSGLSASGAAVGFGASTVGVAAGLPGGISVISNGATVVITQTRN